MTWQSLITLVATNGVTLFLGILSTRQKWFSSNKDNIRETEGIYAEHVGDLWDRVDRVSQELEDTKHERDSLRSKVDILQHTIDSQSTQIRELTKTVTDLKETIQELTNEM